VTDGPREADGAIVGAGLAGRSGEQAARAVLA